MYIYVCVCVYMNIIAICAPICHHATTYIRVIAIAYIKIRTACRTFKTFAHDREKRGEGRFNDIPSHLVLLTTQIHQGIRFSSLKVLVSRVFRPASNLLLRLLHICNNATFTLLHLTPCTIGD